MHEINIEIIIMKYYKRKDSVLGHGSRIFSLFDLFVLLSLILKESCWNLESYKYYLYLCTGTLVSKVIIIWFFIILLLKDSYRRSNIIPSDKFRYENRARALEYL